MAGKETISVVAERLRSAAGCCSNSQERFSAERVERATGIPADDVHQIAQGFLEPAAYDEARLRILDRLMCEVSLPAGVTFEQWLLTRPAGAPAAPALLIREFRRRELADLLR